MNVVYRNQNRRFTLLYDKATDEYYLNVYCGRVNLHNAQVKLLPEQAQAYRGDGPSTLAPLAERIREEENAKEVYGGIPVATDRKRQWWLLGR